MILTGAAIDGDDVEEINTAALRVTEETAIGTGVVVGHGSGRHGGSASEEKGEDREELHDVLRCRCLRRR